MDPFATPEDIERVRGDFDTRERDAAGELLEEASARLRVRVPGIDDRIAGGSLDPVIPKGIVRRMVIDVLNNPEQYVSEQIDDAVYRFDPELLRRRMTPTDDEVADLRPRSGRRSPVGSVRTRPVL